MIETKLMKFERVLSFKWIVGVVIIGLFLSEREVVFPNDILSLTFILFIFYFLLDFRWFFDFWKYLRNLKKDI